MPLHTAALSTDTVTASVATYAGLVATAALAIQLVSEWRTWSTRVTVEMRRMALSAPNETPTPVVLFTITNHSGHQVKITHLGTTPLRRGGPHTFFPRPLPLGVPGPFTIPPRDAITLYQPPDSFAGGDLQHRTRALIATSDGKSFKSKRVRLRDLTVG